MFVYVCIINKKGFIYLVPNLEQIKDGSQNLIVYK